MSFSLTEKALLLLRMTLFTLFVLLLAEPAIRDQPNTKTHWILVDPVLDDSPEIREMRDTVDLRFLAKGFPLVENSEVPEIQPGRHWALIKQASQKVDSLTIISSDLRRNFSGVRPAISIPFRWLSLDVSSESIIQDTLLTYTGQSGNRHVLQLFASNNHTEIEHSLVEGEGASPDTLHFQLIRGENNDQNILLQQAIETIGQYTDLPVLIDTTRTASSKEIDWVINLSNTAYIPEGPAKVLQYTTPTEPGPVILETDDPDVFLLNGNLTVTRLISERFLHHWLRLMDPLGTADLEKQIGLLDQRMMPMDPAPELAKGSSEIKAATTPFSWPFWLMLAALIITERLVAIKRHA